MGFDLGGTKMLATVFDSEFQPLGRRRAKTQGAKGVEKGVERLKKTIHNAVQEAEVPLTDLAGIGIGCPGPLDLDEGVLIDAPNLSWSNVPVKAILEEEFDCPTVIVNDVDAGVYGEYRFGAAKSARCVVGIFPGTGIGGGCVYEGRILRGQRGSCMEIGHMQVMPDGPRCGCGGRGCLEAVASRLAISAAAAQAAYRGQAPNLRKLAGTDLSDIRSGVLAESIRAGDEVVERIVREACGHIGIAVANLVHLLAPDKVVLGGGLVEAMPDLITEAVRTAAVNRVMPSFAQSFQVVTAELGDDATVMGAAAWAQEVVSAGAKLKDS